MLDDNQFEEEAFRVTLCQNKFGLPTLKIFEVPCDLAAILAPFSRHRSATRTRLLPRRIVYERLPSWASGYCLAHGSTMPLSDFVTP